MKNQRKNYCKPKIGKSNQYLCTAGTHYECEYFLRDEVFLSECVHFAMGRCISFKAKRDADKGEL